MKPMTVEEAMSMLRSEFDIEQGDDGAYVVRRENMAQITACLTELQRGFARITHVLTSPNINVDTARFIAREYRDHGTCLNTGWEREHTDGDT